MLLQDWGARHDLGARYDTGARHELDVSFFCHYSHLTVSGFPNEDVLRLDVGGSHQVPHATILLDLNLPRYTYIVQK